MNKIDDRFLTACQEGDTNKMQALCEQGALISGDEHAPDYMRPLASALMCKQWQAAHWLLDHGSDPLLGGSNLDDAFENLHEDSDGSIAQLVDRILAGFESSAVGEPDRDLKKAFYKACEHGHLAFAKRIFRLFSAPTSLEFRHSPVAWAAINGHADVVGWLCTNGWTPQSYRKDALPPSVYAILGKSPGALAALLENGEDPNRTAPAYAARMIRIKHLDKLPVNSKFEIFREGTLLHFTAISGDAECARVLLDAGADPDRLDSEKRTAAALAKLGGKESKTVFQLLQGETSVDTVDANALFQQAILQSSPKGVAEAIDAGANVSQTIRAKFCNQANAMCIAAANDDPELLQMLFDAGGRISQVDGNEIEKPSREGIDLLVDELGLDTLRSIPSVANRPPIAWAAAHGSLNAMHWLVNHDADIDQRDSLQMNALHVAALYRKPKSIEWLLSHGADIAATAFHKSTPLHIAAMARGTEVVTLLLTQGADPTVRNARRETPFDIAKDLGFTTIRRELESVTPKSSRKRTKKQPQPPWEFDAKKREQILRDARKEFGKAARTAANRPQQKAWQKRFASQRFNDCVAQIVKQLKAQQAEPGDSYPNAHRIQIGKLTDQKLLRVQEQWQPENIFLLKESHCDEEQWIYLFPTADPFQSLAAMQLHGINHGIDTSSMIAWLISIHKRYPFRIISATDDSVDLQFADCPEPIDEFIDEVMTICPPADFEMQVQKAIKRKLRRRVPRLLLWWD